MLNEPLAAELGLDPAGCAAPTACGLLVGNRRPRAAPPRSRRPTPGTSSAATPRGSATGGRCCSASSSTPTAALRDLHLKGSGRTPFARGGDGLAAVGPMLREYVVSEAMHALGIPTTRSLAVVATGRAGAARDRAAGRRAGPGGEQPPAGRQLPVRRGPPATSTCCAASPTTRSPATTPTAADAEHPYLALFEAVVAAQASLVAQWMLVGFVHGVMNTDNMTISGETIDYGPCAFMEAFDPATVYSSIDTGGRYAYGNQPVVAEWNLARLAEALLPAARTTTRSRRSRSRSRRSARSAPQYGAAWSAGMRAKLGLPAGRRRRGRRAAGRRPARACCRPSHVDYTSFFRGLGAAARGDAEPARGLFLDLAGVRRLAGALARARPGRRRDGPGQPASTSRATTSSRRPSPPRPTATWTRSNGCWTR